MRILLVTDAWAPQINGVVVTLENTVRWLRRWGHEVEVISPEGFRTIPMPTYPEIPLAVMPGAKVARRIKEVDPDAIHIATEGPLGAAARSYCIKHHLAFTTAYHTCFPEYVKPRFGVPLSLTYMWLRRFHGASSAIFVATPAIRALLEARGFRNIVDWSRDVDTDLFTPGDQRFAELPRPVFLFVGRVAVEKNLPGFLGLDLPGTKLVVGDGPQRKSLEERFPDAVFVGSKKGAELAFLLPPRRRVRVPEPHRHFWVGAGRGDGVRDSRGGLPGARSHRCDQGRGGGRAGRGPRCRRARGAAPRPL